MATPRPEPADETRSEERIRAHYEVEKALAARLLHSTRAERLHLYRDLYDEMYRRVPDHPQLTRKRSDEERARAVDAQMAFLGRFLAPGSTFVEIGAGDCALSLAVARRVKQVYAIDVSDEITRTGATPANFRLVLSDGCTIPVPPGSVDLAYSNQLMEHLHPDDAIEQLENIHRALAPGGLYVCVTPNRLTGPHDVSCWFDSVATCFHLREYTMGEVVALFRRVGFARTEAHVGAKGRSARIPLALLRAIEHALGAVPAGARRRIAGTRVFRALLDARLVAVRN